MPFVRKSQLFSSKVALLHATCLTAIGRQTVEADVVEVRIVTEENPDAVHAETEPQKDR